MLSTQRKKEAKNNVTTYLSDELLKKISTDKSIMQILIKNGDESLRMADIALTQQVSELWAIVCSYYAMFYYANAVLLSFGYKVGTKIVHKVTADALIVYISPKLAHSYLEEYEMLRDEALLLAGSRADTLIESFDLERSKRNTIQYNTNVEEKLVKAKTSIARAKAFVVEMEKLLKK